MPFLIAALRAESEGELTTAVTAGFSRLFVCTADRTYYILFIAAFWAFPDCH